MEYLSTISEKDIGSDGRIRRRYEVEEEKESNKWLNIAKGLILGNALLLIKSLFFSSNDTEAAAKENNSAENQKTVDAGGEKPLKFPTLELIQNPKFENDWNTYLDDFQLEKFTGQPSRFGDNIEAAAVTSLQAQVPIRSARFTGSNIIELPTPANAGPASTGTTGGAPSSSGSSLEPGQKVDSRDQSDDDKNKLPNRLPSVSGPVGLGSIYVNQSIIIGLSSLLFGAHDADGDILKVQNLAASSGTLVVSGPESWTFTPELFDTGAVTFTYKVADAEGAVTQFAELDLLAIPGAEIIGTPGPDRIVGTPGDDRIDGKESDDDIFAREGNDLVYGGDGDDRIVGGSGDDVIYAGPGDDTIFAGEGDDTVFGGDGDDFISGGDGDDTLFGEAGNDTIIGGEGADQAFGDAGDDRIDGKAGNDFIAGGDGADFLSGGADQDIIIGGEGSDTGDGGSGDDLFIAQFLDGDDVYDGGDGIDTYDLSGIGATVVADVSQGTVSEADGGTDEIQNIENVITGAGDDSLRGDDGDNMLSGNAGDDDISGGSGNDELDGGDGDDELSGDAGNDIIVGGDGEDIGNGGDGDDVFLAQTDDCDDMYDGGDGIDTYDISGTSGGATIDLAGGQASGSEIGTDVIANFENATGGEGDDILVANDLENVLVGGGGQDIFVFIEPTRSGQGGHTRDRIEDFEVGDTIDVSLMDGDSSQDGLQRLTFLYDQATFDGVGQILYQYNDDGEAGFTLLQFNIDVDFDDGEWDIDFEIEILGHHEFNSQNLIT